MFHFKVSYYPVLFCENDFRVIIIDDRWPGRGRTNLNHLVGMSRCLHVRCVIADEVTPSTITIQSDTAIVLCCICIAGM
jgi:hypothetical protein